MRKLELTDGAIDRIRAHDQVIRIALRVPNEELAHAILDLARTARREMTMIGFSPAYVEMPVSGYETMLTQSVMPEIAARLNVSGQAPLIRSREEIGDGRILRVSGPELRRVAGLCWSRSDFARIGAAVRSRFDPDGVKAGQVFATEVIGQEPSNGNILEIALTRCVPPSALSQARNSDWFAERILASGRMRGLEVPVPYWTVLMRMPMQDPGPAPDPTPF